MQIRLPLKALVLLWSVWGLLNACVTVDVAKKDAKQTRQSFLWEAQKGATILTLVGTMHIGIQEADMDPLLWKRLDAADTVIIETDVGETDPRLMAGYMSLPANEDLAVLLGGKSWLILLQIVKASGSPMTETQLKRLSPLAAGALLLQIQAKADRDIEGGQISIDQVIFEKGKMLGKKALTLETNKEQLESLKNVFTVEAVQKVLAEWDEETDSYAQLKQAFKDGDSAALDALLQEVPEEMRVNLLEKRNKNWIVKLPSVQGRNSVLAVGAAHYAGPTGLLELLKKEGYAIRPLR